MASELAKRALQAVLVSPVLSHVDLKWQQARCLGSVATGAFFCPGNGGRAKEIEENHE